MGDKSGCRCDATRGTKRLDALFTALADEHRRQVLRYFRAREDEIASVDDIVAFAHDSESRLDRRRLELLFHHATLPKLADLGFVEYDPRSGTVRYRGTPVLERVLDAVEESRVERP